MCKTLTLSLYFIATVTLFSCSKDDAAPATPIDILTGGSSKSWLLINIKSGGKSEMEPCEADDVYSFNKATSKALIEVGAKKCTSGETNSTSDFQLSTDGKTLTLDGISGAITKLTATELEYKFTVFGETLDYSLKAK